MSIKQAAMECHVSIKASEYPGRIPPLVPLYAAPSVELSRLSSGMPSGK